MKKSKRLSQAPVKVEYLSQALVLDGLIDMNIATAEKLKEHYAYSSKTDQINSLIENIINDTKKLLSLKQDIYDLVESIPDETQRSVMRARYIDGMSYLEMTQALNYSERWLLTLHNRALALIEIPESNEELGVDKIHTRRKRAH